MAAAPKVDTERIPSLVWKVGAVAVTGSFLAQMDATIVNVSLGSLAEKLDASLSTIQWVTSGYLLALALMLPLNGWLVGRIGAKALYLSCFTTFTVSSALCGLAWSAESLVGFRVLQGMSGGLMAPMAQMMMARVAGKHMASVLSVAVLPILLAPLLGPSIAGAILQLASWRWLFLVNIPVGAVAVLLAVVLLPDDREERSPRALDFVGLSLLSPGLVLFLYGSEHLNIVPGRSSLAAGVLLLGSFLMWARRLREQAIVELSLFKGRVFRASVGTQFMTHGVSYAGQMLIPYFLTRACGRSPSQTGLLMAPLGLGMMCGYPFVGRWVKRYGNRQVAAAGAAVSLAGTLPLVFLSWHGLGAAALAGALFIRGLGLSAVGVPSISAAYASVPKADLPMATTALNIVMRLGGPTLTTVCATFLGWRLLASQAPEGIRGAFGLAFALLCGFQALLVLATLRLPRSGGDTPDRITPPGLSTSDLRQGRCPPR